MESLNLFHLLIKLNPKVLLNVRREQQPPPQKKLPCCSTLHENNKNYINYYPKSKGTVLIIQFSFRKLAM